MTGALGPSRLCGLIEIDSAGLWSPATIDRFRLFHNNVHGEHTVVQYVLHRLDARRRAVAWQFVAGSINSQDTQPITPGGCATEIREYFLFLCNYYFLIWYYVRSATCRPVLRLE